VNLAGRRAYKGASGGSAGGLAGPLSSRLTQGLAIAALSFGLFCLVWIYGNSLRDPRYLDGWVLTGGMSLQLCFHIARKRGSLTPRSALRWRTLHILLGLSLIAAFAFHTDFSLPDTPLEWALWIGFALVALSGIFGTYLAWWLETRKQIDNVVYDRIPERQAELARAVKTAVAEVDQSAFAHDLPGPAYGVWIADLYTAHLRQFFDEARNTTSLLIGPRRQLARLLDEIDNLSFYVDQKNKEKLADIKVLVIEKDRLDVARAWLGLGRAWLLVHVPATYALTVLVVLHIIVVYAFSAGVW